MLRGGIAYERMTLAWLDDVLATLHRLGGLTARAPPTRLRTSAPHTTSEGDHHGRPAAVQPAHLRPRALRRRDPPAAARHHRLVRGPRQAGARRRLPRPRLATPTSSTSPRRRGCSRPSSPRPPTPTATRTSAGTPRATPRSARSSASTGSTTGTPGRSPSSASARSGRATTPGRQATRAAELLDAGEVMAFGLSEREHGADIYTTDMLLTPATATGRHLPGHRREVLHRQRQRRRAWCRCSAAAPTSRAPTATSSSPPTAATRNYHLVDNVVHDADVRQHVPAGGLPGARGGHPAHRRGRLRRRAQHRQRRQVQPVHRLDRHVRARVLRGDHPRAQPHPLRQPGHRLPARARELRRRLRPAGRDEAVQRPRRRLLPQRRASTTGATCCSTR